jgi:hypothetical protein
MVSPRRTRHNSATGWRIALWASVLTVGALLWLNNSPVHLSADAEQAAGEPSSRSTESDILAVIDWRAIYQSESTFRGRDWSAAWLGMLRQTVGPVTVATPETMSADKLQAARVIVLTHSVADQVPEALLDRLRERALDGAVIVVERPGGRLRDAFSANGRAGVQTGRAFTHADGLSDPFRSQLLEMPVETQYVGSTSPRDNARTLLSIDGAPAVYAVPIGDGTVVTVDFDVGEQLVALQQGRPDQDFDVSKRGAGEGSETVPTVDALMMDSALEGSSVPWADLLERFLVYGVIGRYTPLPTLWGFPGGASGAVVPLHPDSRLGDGIGWMLDYENRKGATSTLFASVDSGLSAAEAAVIARQGGHFGLLWRRHGTPAELAEPRGFQGLYPVAWPVTLGGQLERLGGTLPDGPPSAVKIAGRWWDRDWAAPFRQMAAHGIKHDASFEPSKPGYAFGTGLPTPILDASGLPLGVYEWPVVLSSMHSEGPDLTRLLEGSRKGHHQVLTWSLPPASFADYPDLSRFDDWIDAFEAVRRANHLITDIDALADYRQQRRRSTVSSRILRDVAPPEGPGGEPAEGDGLLLRVSIETSSDRTSLTVPSSIDGFTFREARRRASRVGGELVAQGLTTQPEEIIGYGLQRIPLDGGSSRIDVYYAARQD